MAPALRFPISANMDQFKRDMDGAKSKTAEATKVIVRNFADMNKEVVVLAARAATGVSDHYSMVAVRGALAFVKLAGAVAIAVKAIGFAVSGAREQIAELVAISDKATNLGVSGRFLQSFTAEAQRLKISTDDLEDALRNASDATKERPPIDVDAWKVGEERITGVEKALRVYNQELAKAAGTRLEGLVLFRDAETQDQKVMAVLTAMRELEAIGQRTAALDLAERMFGSKFADNIRLGKTSVDQMLESIKRAQEAGSGIFSDEVLRRTKEIDNELKRVQQRLDNELKPSWIGVVNYVNDIKRAWTAVIDLIGQAVAAANRFTNAGDIAYYTARVRDLKEAMANGTALHGLAQVPAEWSRAVGLEPAQERMPKMLADAEAKLAEALGQSNPLRITVPAASRGEGAAPTKPGGTEGGSTKDAFESEIDAINRHIARMEADTEAMGLGAGAQAQFRAEAALTEAMMRAGIEINDDYAAKIIKIAEAAGKAAEQLEKAKDKAPLANFARDAANLDRQLTQLSLNGLKEFEDGFADVIMGTKSVADAFKSMADAIIRDLIRIAIRQSITGPLAAALSNMGGLGGLFGGGGGAAGAMNGGINVGNAAGTEYWRGGPTLVGESGPERLDLPRGSRITPNHVMRQAGGEGGGVVANFAPVIHLTGTNAVTKEELTAVIAAQQRQFLSNTVASLRHAQRRSML